MRKLLPFLLLSVLGLLSCAKDDLEVADLNNNPFDPAYVGENLFELVSADVAYESVNGVTQSFFRVEVRCRTDRFLSPTPFNVRYKRSNTEVWGPFQYNATTTIIKQYGYAVGQEFCWDFQLGNGGGIGAGNRICATVE
ncbi:MAG TPA: hypothetical protein VGE21_16045 [Flavobacteriales bacterium]